MTFTLSAMTALLFLLAVATAHNQIQTEIRAVSGD